MADPIALLDNGDPRVEAGAVAIYRFLEAQAAHGQIGLRVPWEQATEVGRDKARMLAAVVLEAALAAERQEAPVRDDGEVSAGGLAPTPPGEPTASSAPVMPVKKPHVPCLPKVAAFLKQLGAEFPEEGVFRAG